MKRPNLFSSLKTELRNYTPLSLPARLKRNDGGLAKLRLNSERLDDELLKIICSVLPGNLYLQQLMLHDNVITGTTLDTTDQHDMAAWLGLD